MENKEIWKDVPTFEGLYQVSSLGNVRSLDRIVVDKRGGIKRYESMPIKSRLNRYGYLKIGLRNVVTGQKTFNVHQLVVWAFIGHAPSGNSNLVTDHINEIKTDNRIVNLQAITNRENTSRSVKNATSIYTGVCWNKQKKKWTAYINIDKQKKHLGQFNCETKASLVYDKELKKILL